MSWLQVYRGRFPMLEPGPFTTLLGGPELLAQLQDPRPEQAGKSEVMSGIKGMDIESRTC